MKPPAAEPHLLQHTGPALVFDNYAQMKKAVADPDLDVTADHIMVLRHAGPIGGPGMPNGACCRSRRSCSNRAYATCCGISDARMSGTSYGACILHVAPEAAIGGPLAALRTGDMITVDVHNRRIDVALSDAEIADRLKGYVPRRGIYPRGYYKMYTQHPTSPRRMPVATSDFLEGSGGIPEPEIN